MESCVGLNVKKMVKHTIGVGKLANHGTTALLVNFILSFSHFRYNIILVCISYIMAKI